MYAPILRNNTRFGAIAVEAQAPQVCGGELDGVPFEYDGSLSGVSAADDGWGGGSEAVGVEDGGLEGGEGFLGCEFGLCVPGYCYVDYGTGGYRGGKENGGEFDLWIGERLLVELVLGRNYGANGGEGGFTRRLSSVRRTATPASTLPTVRDISILL